MRNLLYSTLLMSFISCAQDSSSFISKLPQYKMQDTWSASNSSIRGFDRDGINPVPKDLMDKWQGSNYSLIDENGAAYTRKARFFKGDVRAIGKVQISNDFTTLLYCRFSEDQSQRVCALATIDSSYSLISLKQCFRNSLEMTGFYRVDDDQVMILTSGEEFVTENLIEFTKSGLIQDVSSIEVAGPYDFK